jgi:S1-C subfamily serine protease
MDAAIRVMAAVVIVVSATSFAAAKEDDDAKGYLGVAIRLSDNGGVSVQSLQDESPAMKAGLKENDRIIKVNGEAVKSLQEFVEKIGSFKPGTEIKLLIVRDTDEKEIKVKLGTRPVDQN